MKSFKKLEFGECLLLEMVFQIELLLINVEIIVVCKEFSIRDDPS